MSGGCGHRFVVLAGLSSNRDLLHHGERGEPGALVSRPLLDVNLGSLTYRPDGAEVQIHTYVICGFGEGWMRSGLRPECFSAQASPKEGRTSGTWRWNPTKRCIVSGCWELKRKFRGKDSPTLRISRIVWQSRLHHGGFRLTKIRTCAWRKTEKGAFWRSLAYRRWYASSFCFMPRQ